MAEPRPPAAPGGDEPPGPKVLRVSRTLTIPMADIGWRASTSGGPGGQHANRTNSRVEVWLDLDACGALGPRQRARLVRRLGPVARASASEDRSQARNRQLALERLRTRLAEALKEDAPRRPTRPGKGAVERRLESKHRRSAAKQARRRPGPED